MGLLKKHPRLVLAPDAPLRAAMKAMTDCQVGLIVVADKSRKLLGVITDIDIRRSLLAGGGIDTPVAEAMNKTPVTIKAGAPPELVSELFRKTGHENIPVVDAKGRLLELENIFEFSSIPQRYPNTVVLMAGGEGKRLRPLTARTPKPMLKLGGKPLLEHLIEQLSQSGFVRFIVTVNYLAGKIRSHFGDGSRWGVQIEYVQEPKPLGTAGALGLIKKRFEHPVLVMNGDVLTKANFAALLDFHKAEKGLATVCVKKHEIEVPYGVVRLDGRKLDGFAEKPTHRFLINAGIYVLDPKALPLIPRGKRCDMPELLERVRAKRKDGVACFPIEEYWLDIGGLSEFQRANSEFGRVFGT